MNRAACYLRSSKDRSDVSIDAQRRALQEMATAKGYVVVTEFSDAVESGKDDDRPGFQQLVRAVEDKRRGWEILLLLDTSRLARRVMIALAFEDDCAKHGITIVYKNLPDMEPAEKALFKLFMQGMDQYHSLKSKAKGLAGMAENVRQGWRAGGKAPRGYDLEYHSTGAIREGAPVLKSKLKPNDDAPRIGRYLKARAAGQPRGLLISELQLPWTDGSLNDMEWMALTYAGHTVWGATNELTNDGYVNGTKRKPRDQWTVQRDTHPALITNDEAEAILAALEKGRIARVRHTEHPYLLTGYLFTSDGQQWCGEWDNRMNAGLYRLGKGRRISARRVDEAVLELVLADLMGDRAVELILRAMRALVEEPADAKKLPALEKRITTLTNKIGRLVDLLVDAGEHERAAFRRSIEACEAERGEALVELDKLRTQAAQQREAKRYTATDVRRLLRLFADSVETEDLETTKAALGGFVERIVLDEGAENFHIHYRIGATDTGVEVATLRGFEVTPVRWVSAGIVAKKNGTSG